MAKSKINYPLIIGVAAIAYFLYKKKSIDGIGGSDVDYKDPDAAREMEIYINNNNDLYRSRHNPILKNLSKKHKKGVYDVQKAAKLFTYLIQDGMQRYAKEFGSGKWNTLLSTSDRKLLALEFAREALDEFNLGNYTEI